MYLVGDRVAPVWSEAFASIYAIEAAEMKCSSGPMIRVVNCLATLKATAGVSGFDILVRPDEPPVNLRDLIELTAEEVLARGAAEYEPRGRELGGLPRVHGTSREHRDMDKPSYCLYPAQN